MVTLGILGLAGIERWQQSTVVLIGRTLSYSSIAAPVVGLILGLYGKLPGTKICHNYDA